MRFFSGGDCRASQTLHLTSLTSAFGPYVPSSNTIVLYYANVYDSNVEGTFEKYQSKSAVTHPARILLTTAPAPQETEPIPSPLEDETNLHDSTEATVNSEGTSFGNGWILVKIVWFTIVAA
ncbi:hypothetical protein EG68_04250 [Paragonimus skrjabini miyazakii]|uniref:Uncharacterized protein n=1 Tax=Paragonimus skrjabini miyazakii TaxID=59628 RepID=A0A8S9Z2F7_9TREM|nr:hypothetical protein EG68_04250 [Paragonimus skrjabini miyazakii]